MHFSSLHVPDTNLSLGSEDLFEELQADQQKIEASKSAAQQADDDC